MNWEEEARACIWGIAGCVVAIIALLTPTVGSSFIAALGFLVAGLNADKVLRLGRRQ